MAAIAQEVLGYLREQRQVLVGFLERLALAESASTEPGAQNEALDILSEALIEIGYAVWRLPGRWSGGHIYARPEGRRAPAQLLLGHCDTVWPLGTLDETLVEETSVSYCGRYDFDGGTVPRSTSLFIASPSR